MGYISDRLFDGKGQDLSKSRSVKREIIVLANVAQLIEHHHGHPKVTGLISGQGKCPDWGFGPH